MTADAEWRTVARRLGVMSPKHPDLPSVRGLLKRLAERYRQDPERVIALLAAAAGIEQVAPQ